MSFDIKNAKNPSFVLEGVGKVKFEDRPVPRLKNSHDVLINVQYTGICGSDVHYWQHGGIGDLAIKGPMVLGHESSGIVAEIGPAVKSLKVGDRVAMEPGIPCRFCEQCKSGKYNLCAAMTFAASPPVDGTLARYYVLPADFCYKLADSMELIHGALMEPLAVAVHITRRGEVKPGNSVVVFGAGPVGLLCCAVARVHGAMKVIAVDVQPARLEFAKGYVATGTYVPIASAPATENAETLRAEHGLSDGADVAIDASGVEQSVQTGIHVLRAGGTYVQGGMGRSNCNFPIMAACFKELTVKGSFRYSSGDYKLALQLIASGTVSVKELVSEVVEFTDAERAFEDVKKGRVIKAVIRGPDNLEKQQK